MTSEPGDDCPECGERRTSSTSCVCGWRASSSSRCAECGADVVNLDDDGVLRCAACHVTYLRARAVLDPIDPAELARCRAEIRAALARVATRLGPAPPGSRSIAVSDPPGSELSGSHPENSPS